MILIFKDFKILKVGKADVLNCWTLGLISITKFNRWLISHFCPVILARIHSARVSWTILTKNKGHISARIYLARVISAFVGWIISADKHFCPEYSGKASAKIGLNKWGTFLHELLAATFKSGQGQLFQQGHYVARNAKQDIQSSWIFGSSFWRPNTCKDSPRSAYFPLLLQLGRWESAACVTDSQGK